MASCFSSSVAIPHASPIPFPIAGETCLVDTRDAFELETSEPSLMGIENRWMDSRSIFHRDVRVACLLVRIEIFWCSGGLIDGLISRLGIKLFSYSLNRLV